MLFCDQIKDFEDFKSRFGYKTGIDGRYLVNANGAKQRKNNVIYLFWKEECVYLYKKRGYSLVEAYNCAHRYENIKDVFRDMLYAIFRKDISDVCPVSSFNNYYILSNGICVDGDVNSIRYQDTSTTKIYKMKIGKYVNKYIDWLIEYNPSKVPFWVNNTTLRIFFVEEITELWKNKRLKEQSLHVVVDKDFSGIYDFNRREKESNHFGSCMDGHENWKYYRDHCDIYDAVSLQDNEGLIYARAILVHCFDQNNNPHLYLERIYSNKRMYKDLLFEKAKIQGVMDLYKGLEASCHDNKEIYTVSNNHKINYKLYIPLELEDGDYMSYQDTFKWYYKDVNKAYNSEMDLGFCTGLATTNLEIEI